MPATRSCLVVFPLLLAAAPISGLAAQATTAIPAAPYRGTLSLGNQVVIAIQIRGSQSGPRIQLAVGAGMDDTTSRPMRRDPRGDTLLAVVPGLGDTLRFAARLEGEALRGTVRQGGRTGTFALRRVVELPLDALKRRVGDYRLDDNTLFSVGGGDNVFDGLSFTHFGTGRTGLLFAVDSTRFVAGPRRYDADPMSYTVQFGPDDRINVSTAEGRQWRGKRTVISREHEVSIPTTGGVQLAGTFTVPTGRGPHPAVILLQGSDPHGRMRGGIVTFFASRGIAVLTWDKRGTGGSGGSLVTVNIDTLAADGAAGIRWLRARPEIDPGRVGVWGISQGGWPASILAARDSSLAFVILHAGSSLTPSVQGEDEMRMRVLENGGTQGEMDDFLAYYRRYNEVLRGAATQQSLEAMYAELRDKGNRYIWSPSITTSPRSRWQAGIMDFDPVPNWSTARVPVVAFFGEFDGYVPPETNVPGLRAAFARSGNPDTTIVILPGANHRFEESSRRVSRDWMIGSRYRTEYFDAMAAWLDRRLTREKT